VDAYLQVWLTWAAHSGHQLRSTPAPVLAQRSTFNPLPFCTSTTPPQDLPLLGLTPDRVSFASDHFQAMAEATTALIKANFLYADDTPVAEVRAHVQLALLLPGTNSTHSPTTLTHNTTHRCVPSGSPSRRRLAATSRQQPAWRPGQRCRPAARRDGRTASASGCSQTRKTARCGILWHGASSTPPTTGQVCVRLEECSTHMRRLQAVRPLNPNSLSMAARLAPCMLHVVVVVVQAHASRRTQRTTLPRPGELSSAVSGRECSPTPPLSQCAQTAASACVRRPHYRPHYPAAAPSGWTWQRE
jgi:hypothetical protein